MFTQFFFSSEERTSVVPLDLLIGWREMGFAVAMQATAPTTRTDLSEGSIVILVLCLSYALYGLVCGKTIS